MMNPLVLLLLSFCVSTYLVPGCPHFILLMFGTFVFNQLYNVLCENVSTPQNKKKKKPSTNSPVSDIKKATYIIAFKASKGKRKKHEVQHLTKSEARNYRKQAGVKSVSLDLEVTSQVVLGSKKSKLKITKKPDKTGKPGSNTTSDLPDQMLPEDLWHLQMVGYPFTQNASVRTTHLFVIDTGILSGHPDLENSNGTTGIVPVAATVQDPGKGSETNDGNGHGTHVAGISACRDNLVHVIGINSSLNVYAVKVLDKRGSGSMSSVMDGLLAVEDFAAQKLNTSVWNPSTDRVVLNMSLGGGRSDSLNNLISDLVNPFRFGTSSSETALSKLSCVAFVAAGNSNIDVKDSSPGSCPDVIAVGAIDSGGNKASFSNYASQESDKRRFVNAPGVDIWSIYKDVSQVVAWSGTSMACPVAAGVSTGYSYSSNANGTHSSGRPFVEVVRDLISDSQGITKNFA